MRDGTKILVVDDEPTILETVENKMRKEGYSTFCADTAEQAMHLYRRVKPDLILLDIMLPNRSGYDLCRAIRREGQTPIIFMSARAAETDRIKGLDMGADDYITKPFNLTEVAARVKAVLRRSHPNDPVSIVNSNGLEIDPKAHQVRLNGQPIELPPKEFALLYFLASHPEQVFNRDILLDRVWGREAYVTSRTIDVHIRWLRAKIEKDPERPTRLLTVRGVGYKFSG